jgi:hypothetical protein
MSEIHYDYGNYENIVLGIHLFKDWANDLDSVWILLRSKNNEARTI